MCRVGNDANSQLVHDMWGLMSWNGHKQAVFCVLKVLLSCLDCG